MSRSPRFEKLCDEVRARVREVSTEGLGKTGLARPSLRGAPSDRHT